MGNKINPSYGDIFPENNETQKLPPQKDGLDNLVRKATSALHDLLEKMHSIQEVDRPKILRLFSEKLNPRVQLHNRLIEAKHLFRIHRREM